jgi:hypothetical protein
MVCLHERGISVSDAAVAFDTAQKIGLFLSLVRLSHPTLKIPVRVNRPLLVGHLTTMKFSLVCNAPANLNFSVNYGRSAGFCNKPLESKNMFLTTPVPCCCIQC